MNYIHTSLSFFLICFNAGGAQRDALAIHPATLQIHVLAPDRCAVGVAATHNLE